MYYDVIPADKPNVTILSHRKYCATMVTFYDASIVLESVIVTKVHGYKILLVFPQMLMNCDVTHRFMNIR